MLEFNLFLTFWIERLLSSNDMHGISETFQITAIVYVPSNIGLSPQLSELFILFKSVIAIRTLLKHFDK